MSDNTLDLCSLSGSLNPYYTGSTLWVPSPNKQGKFFFVLILIILEVLYECGQIVGYVADKLGLNPYYTGSTLWGCK